MQEPDFDRLDSSFAWMRDYLARLAPEGGLPGRQHIDPADFAKYAHRVNLAEAVRIGGRLRFRFRLVGTTQTRMAGREITGKFVEDAVLPEFAARILGNMRAAVETAKPVYDRFPMPHPERTRIDSERVYFPLARDGKTVDMLLILNNYLSVPAELF